MLTINYIIYDGFLQSDTDKHLKMIAAASKEMAITEYR